MKKLLIGLASLAVLLTATSASAGQDTQAETLEINQLGPVDFSGLYPVDIRVGAHSPETLHSMWLSQKAFDNLVQLVQQMSVQPKPNSYYGNYWGTLQITLSQPGKPKFVYILLPDKLPAVFFTLVREVSSNNPD